MCTQVSDHEWLSGYPELASTAEQARSMVAEGHSEGIVARLHVADGAPMTARRYLSLYRARGDDDMFSQHFSDTELQVRSANIFTRDFRLTTNESMTLYEIMQNQW